MTEIHSVLLTAVVVLILLSVVITYRVFVGPTMQDRVIAINAVGSNIVVVIALLSAATNSPTMLDIAIVYALLNFLVSIAISKFTVERGGVL